MLRTQVVPTCATREMFQRAYRLRAGTLDGVDDTVAFAYGRRIYLRGSSPSILTDTVHEGKHAIDFLDGFTGTTQQWERRDQSHSIQQSEQSLAIQQYLARYARGV